jgi:DNA-binding NtrC family response regulator
MVDEGITTMGIEDPFAAGGACPIGLEVLDGPDRERFLPASGTELTVGSSADNDLVLADPSVSPHHLWLRSRDGILVRDLGSRSGTFLGGVRIREATVPLGARLRLGDTVIRLTDRGPDVLPEGPPERATSIPGLVCVSPAMREVVRAIERLACSDVSVLVSGETGTGKELVSRALHDLGPRAGRPYVIVDVGALSPTLVASQLFGHERGAFTGAETRQQGAFEQAHGGSILLDEIGELPASVQPTLLGVLERRTFRRLGGKEEIHVDVRVIAATHRDLRAEVKRGAFRDDLYFRITAARINVPPLRERPDDIPPLAEHFARQAAGAAGAVAVALVSGVLKGHPWPGNVRELRNVVEGALTTGNLTVDGLRAEIAGAHRQRPDVVVPYKAAREAALGAFERTYVRGLLESTGGNAAAAARLARMDRSYLLTLLRKLRIRTPSHGRGAPAGEARPAAGDINGLPRELWDLADESRRR